MSTPNKFDAFTSDELCLITTALSSALNAFSKSQEAGGQMSKKDFEIRDEIQFLRDGFHAALSRKG